MSTGPCYIGSNNVISKVRNFWPCYDGNATNPYVSCCAVGHVCLSNGLCQYSDPPTSGSGVYTGGCTDGSYTDGSCTPYCKPLAGSEVIYSDNSWHCCGVNSSNPRCNDPEGPDFDDPSPYLLTKVALIEGTSSTATAHSEFPTAIAAFTSGQSYAVFGTATPTNTVAVTQTAAQSTTTSISSILSLTTAQASVSSTSTSNNVNVPVSSGMSTGAIVGMVVGIVSLLALTAAALRFSCIYRRSQRGAGSTERGMCTPESHDQNFKDFPSGPKSYDKSDLQLSGSVQSPISPMTPHESSRFTSKKTPVQAANGNYGHTQVAYELQNPMGNEVYELVAESRPAEMMAVPGIEDRMAGGGPDKRLPTLPSTPLTGAKGGRARPQSDTSRYRSLLEKG